MSAPWLKDYGIILIEFCLNYDSFDGQENVWTLIEESGDYLDWILDKNASCKLATLFGHELAERMATRQTRASWE